MNSQPDAKSIATLMAEQEAAAKTTMIDYPIIIDELNDLLDDLRTESAEELEKSILADGIRDNVIVWKERNAIIDGHNRISIAKKHNLPFPKQEISFASLDEAKSWMIQNQLGRRNLTADRFDYLLGKLYNERKQKSDKPGNLGGLREKSDGPDASKEIAEKFGVSERTVRRAGETALGIDKLEAIKGKIAKQEQLSGKGEYNKAELTQLGKMTNATTGAKMLKKLDELKDQEKKQKAAAKAAAKAPAKTGDVYPVIFCRPDFEALGGFNVNSEPKPPMDKNCIIYMFVPDNCVTLAMRLLEKWGLVYEGSFVFYDSSTEEGTFSKICHDFLFMATRGTVIGPKRGSEAASVQMSKGQRAEGMIKLIDSYHTKERKLDTRKGRQAPGWETYTRN